MSVSSMAQKGHAAAQCDAWGGLGSLMKAGASLPLQETGSDEAMTEIGTYIRLQHAYTTAKQSTPTLAVNLLGIGDNVMVVSQITCACDPVHRVCLRLQEKGHSSHNCRTAA
eukprot:1160808-Pelagomonas_calceolata.AAC.27